MTTSLGRPASTANRRIVSFTALPSPRQFRETIPLTADLERQIERDREEIAAIIQGTDPRLLVVVGPCSIHDVDAALEYARRLAPLARRHAHSLKLVMRVYFEKPRTTVGWKGLINDPHLDGSNDAITGLAMARKLLVEILELGLPIGCEFLEPTTPQYIADTVAWGAIGARTTESQVHRTLASGLSAPIGFKNATDGNIQMAADGAAAAGAGHVFFGTDDEGAAAIVETAGNENCHVILRGGRAGTNYGTMDVREASGIAAAAGVPETIMIDASHANSGKDHLRQAQVAGEVAAQVAAGERRINGVMLESFLEPGAQSISAEPLVFGKSITDKCMGWEPTVEVLERLAEAQRLRSAAD